MIRMLDLFSGIGGFSLAATWAFGNELEIVSFCEIDKFCQKVLNKNFPDVPIHNDIKTLQGGRFGTIDIITGGFPCQSFSKAGKRLGKKDDRYLWPEMFRVIKEARPNWIIGENVTGIINMALDEVLTNLESKNYETQTFIIPACAVNAPHQRERVWIVANSKCNINQQKKQRIIVETNKLSKQYWQKDSSAGEFGRTSSVRETDNNNVSDSNSKRLQTQRKQERVFETKRETCSGIERSYCMEGGRNSNWWDIEPELGRMVNGIPNRVDRLKSLGNAIVPQIAYEIFDIIKSVYTI